MSKGWLLTLLLPGCCTPAPSSAFVLHTRSRAGAEVVEQTVIWAPERTAIIVCDMWDDHWCAGAARRVGELAVPMNAMLAAARARGAFIIHAPSSVVSFYEGTSQRTRAQEAAFSKTPVPLSQKERWGTAWCWPDPEREPDMPIDDSDMGCDCDTECELREAWTRQHATLQLDPADALTDDGQETWNLLEERGIEHVVLCGVHLNMCVLGRPFAIRQMVNLGKDVVLMRDMTDSMYDRDSEPFVDHFSGTDLVVEHVERHWCPSMESTAITGLPAFRFAEDQR